MPPPLVKWWIVGTESKGSSTHCALYPSLPAGTNEYWDWLCAKRPQACAGRTHWQEAEVNMNVFVCVASVSMAWVGRVVCLCALPNRIFNFTTLSLSLCLSIHLSAYLFLTLSLSLFVADQQQVEADWEGVQSKACQVCPGNHFFSTAPFPLFHFTFLFFFPLNHMKVWTNVLMGEVRKHVWKHTR